MTRSAHVPIRVLLVGNHQVALWGMRKLIEDEKPSMEVVGTAANAADALTMTRDARPDVVLVDLDLNEQRGLGVLSELVSQGLSRVLVITGSENPEIHDRAVLMGARGVLHKEEPAHTLLKATQKVHSGELWLDRSATGRLFVELARAQGARPVDPEQRKIATLTSREREIVATMASDAAARTRAIAERLKVSENTLRNHLTSIYSKLGIASRLELFVYATKHGLTNRPALAPST